MGSHVWISRRCGWELLGVRGYRRTIPGGLLGFPVVQIWVADWGPMYGYLGGVAGGYLVSGAIEGVYLEDC